MPVQNFTFAVELSGTSPGVEMLGDLAGKVLGHVGCAAARAPAVVAAVREAVTRAAERAGGSAVLEFAAAGGTLRIAVSSRAETIWATTVAIG